jgi:hypothetical protein
MHCQKYCLDLDEEDRKVLYISHPKEVSKHCQKYCLDLDEEDRKVLYSNSSIILQKFQTDTKQLMEQIQERVEIF